MNEYTPNRGSAIFNGVAVDVEDTRIQIAYPVPFKTEFEYDFIYTRGHQWVYLFSHSYPKFLGFETRAKILASLGCRWKVIEVSTGNIMWEGEADDKRHAGNGRSNQHQQQAAIEHARSYERGYSSYDFD